MWWEDEGRVNHGCDIYEVGTGSEETCPSLPICGSLQREDFRCDLKVKSDDFQERKSNRFIVLH